MRKLISQALSGFTRLLYKQTILILMFLFCAGIALANMALDMQQEVARFNARHNTTLSIRIGINTGPVVAGVIGTKKFIYDLWGDAVNTASRMESHGLAGSIQVTQSTYECLQDNYQFEARGVIEFKGKGEMMTYLLTGKKVETLVG